MGASSPENCSVKVAVHIRPWIAEERGQGCRECVTVTPGKPQVQIGSHSFTFDHVYGNGGCPSSEMFEECIAPLVDGLFQGYNATVIAYGQTGSGKTYTMGTALKDGGQTGLILQVMNTLFNKIDIVKSQTEFQLHVSFIEILKEEVRDLLDSVCYNKFTAADGHSGKTVPGRPPIQIRESSNGVISPAGAAEVAVTTTQEMAACLEQGSLSRATKSTNMNNQSSRSHAIFTITLEQMRKIHSSSPNNDNPDEDIGEEYFCAKLHLVDLAGSERAKRTGSDGLCLKEGIHVNRGLLALGNVISALGDEKKRKEGIHVPYRDSKLTRLLQDSLGGNSKTVMIACVSPADINAEETLNTLKYANRARNIQNKPVANKDIISSEIQIMREQPHYLQAVLCACEAVPLDEVQVLKERISRLEATNKELSQELHVYRSRCAPFENCEVDEQESHVCFMRSDGLKRGLQSIDSSDYEMSEVTEGGNPGEIDEVAKEWEHAFRKNNMDNELNELNRCLEQKESEMKLYGAVETEALKQHFEKKIMELEKEKKAVQLERDRLLAEIDSLAANSNGHLHNRRGSQEQKLKALEAQILDLKKKQENQVELLKQKRRSEEVAKRLQSDIQCIKAQKVILQQRMKKEEEQYWQWKVSHGKELSQMKKERRRNEHQRLKLEALKQCQRMVLQRKTEEAAMATERLKELEARNSSPCDNSAHANGQMPIVQTNENLPKRWLDHELEVMVNVPEVRSEQQKQIQVRRAALAEELASLIQADAFASIRQSPQERKHGQSRFLPSNAIEGKTFLENMLSISSKAFPAMASQLSEAEERKHNLFARGPWNQLQSMADAKNLLQYMFNAAAKGRYQVWEKNRENKEMEEQLNELKNILTLSADEKRELMKEQKIREQTVSIALATTALQTSSCTSSKDSADGTSGPLSPISLPAPKPLKFTPGIVNVSARESAEFIDQTRKMVPTGQSSMNKLVAVGKSGRFWKWKRSHHLWLLQFKWKWQKPWKLSEWIKHSDETIMRFKPRPQSLVDVI